MKNKVVFFLMIACTMEGKSMRLSSPAFQDGGQIPALYTCEGKDISPELHIADVPKDAQSLVLVCDDPDAPDPKAPKMTWVHWVIFNLTPDTAAIPENANAQSLKGAVIGLNSWHKNKYGGPCPPIGSHRYFFKLYALDSRLMLPASATKDDVLTAMEGHVLANAQLMGRYEKKHV